MLTDTGLTSELCLSSPGDLHCCAVRLLYSLICFLFFLSACRKCALSGLPRTCKHRIMLGDSGNYYYISPSCRARVSIPPFPGLFWALRWKDSWVSTQTDRDLWSLSLFSSLGWLSFRVVEWGSPDLSQALVPWLCSFRQSVCYVFTSMV